ncbi:MAG: hypothetical protein R6X18_02570 [Chloroflexota bacterium]
MLKRRSCKSELGGGPGDGRAQNLYLRQRSLIGHEAMSSSLVRELDVSEELNRVGRVRKAAGK